MVEVWLIGDKRVAEAWKDIKGYEGLYQISNIGRVKSLSRIDSRGNKRNEKILKISKNNSGYYFVGLCKNGKVKQYLIHRLVAEAFVRNPYNYSEVNHKDEDKQNNIADNLEWCTHEYNCKYGTRNKRVLETKKRNRGDD